MGPPSYMWSVVDRNVVMRHMTVHKTTYLMLENCNFFFHYKLCLNLLVTRVLRTIFEPTAGDVRRQCRTLRNETYNSVSRFPVTNI
jgi:hypothetical protein